MATTMATTTAAPQTETLVFREDKGLGSPASVALSMSHSGIGMGSLPRQPRRRKAVSVLGSGGSPPVGRPRAQDDLELPQGAATSKNMMRLLEEIKEKEVLLEKKLEQGKLEKKALEERLKAEEQQEQDLARMLQDVKEKGLELAKQLQQEQTELAEKQRLEGSNVDGVLGVGGGPSGIADGVNFHIKRKRANTMTGQSHPDARPVNMPRTKEYKGNAFGRLLNKKKHKKQKIGRTITKDDKSYELMFDMLLGIRVTVSKETAKRITREPNSSDFRRKTEYWVPSRGTNTTPAHPCRDFKFRDYAPLVFRLLRDKFNIDSADYLISLTGDYILSEIVSPGKSGSFFYFSHDTRFMLKTITNFETRFLKKILPSYYEHVMKHPNTLIARFFGFHSVKPHNGRRYHFVVMGNIFAQSLAIHERYDLKGSTVGRTVGESKKKDPNVVMKDLDLGDRKICLGPEKRQIFFRQLDEDCRYLASNDIMDYSLLLGIHKPFYEEKDVEIVEVQDDDAYVSDDETLDDAVFEPEALTIFTQDAGGFGATDEQNQPVAEIYFMGIIDILQPYNLKKRLEHSFKSISHPETEISSVEPTFYATRFINFIKEHTSTEDSEKIKFPEEWVADEEDEDSEIEAKRRKEKKKQEEKERKQQKKEKKQKEKADRKEEKRAKKEEKRAREQEEKLRKRGSKIKGSLVGGSNLPSTSTATEGLRLPPSGTSNPTISASFQDDSSEETPNTLPGTSVLSLTGSGKAKWKVSSDNVGTSSGEHHSLVASSQSN